MTGEQFLWGVATSAYQSEGGYNGPGDPRTNWAAAEERGEVERCGRAAEFWTRFRDDFDLCRELGLNAFRLGIEWSRVQPSFRANEMGTEKSTPEFSYAALEHYAEILCSCRSAGLEPIVTLHHFTHPAWLGTDPWIDARTPELFEIFVTRTVSFLNEKLRARGHEPIRFFVTINEPNMLVFNTYLGKQFPSGDAPAGLQSITAAINNLLIAHIRAFNAIHDLYATRGWAEPLVTFNNYCSDLYWLDKFLTDLLAAAERNVPRMDVERYICRKRDEFEQAFRAARIPFRKDLPYYFGAALKWISNVLGGEWFSAERFAPALDAAYGSKRARLSDYIALDYYDPFAAHIFRLPMWPDHETGTQSPHAWLMNAVTSKWWDWRVLPSGLHFFCKYYAQDYPGRPVLIAENGIALRRRWNNEHTHRRDKITRSEFLRLHVREVRRIIADGVPLIGYLHWSLFDNYEWGSYTPRFGLFSLDYTRDSERLAEDHTGDRPAETYARLIREAREKTRLAKNAGSLA